MEHDDYIERAKQAIVELECGFPISYRVGLIQEALQNGVTPDELGKTAEELAQAKNFGLAQANA